VTVSIRNITIVLRHGEEQISKGWGLSAFQMAQALVLHHIYDDHSGFTVLGDRLWHAPRGIDNFAEAILRVLYRPVAPSHIHHP
jgi:hypothetical protein